MTQHYRLALAASFTMAALVASVSLGLSSALWSGLCLRHLLCRHLLRPRVRLRTAWLLERPLGKAHHPRPALTQKPRLRRRAQCQERHLRRIIISAHGRNSFVTTRHLHAVVENRLSTTGFRPKIRPGCPPY